MSEQGGRDWKATINLPTTGFPMKADLAIREKETVARWRAADLYGRMRDGRKGAPSFTLHDGPPYANGNIHHGHALNKILKDIVIKYHAMAGYAVTNIPGWDCHGLPIEQKVDEELGRRKAELSVVEIREACRAYAQRFVETQAREFERLLVLADWDRPYRTMDAAFEASIVRQLGRFMEKGYVFKGLKPVHWSWSAVTALAEAEVEYGPYDAPSCYAGFPFAEGPSWLLEAAGGRSVEVVIWTTTAWTLCSNLAIALNPELEYALVALDEGRAIVVASGLLESVARACRLEGTTTLLTFAGSRLVGTGESDCPRHAASHPFLDRASVLLPADYVTLEQGTGCVHTAPGHGPDDYALGQRFGLPVLSPVDPAGRYTDEVPEWAGLHVFKANPLIMQRLAETGRLLNQPGDIHRVERYPHCWRTRKPLIFRATPQWFVGVDRDGGEPTSLRTRCLDAIGETQWIPPWGENRIRGMLESRPDWCISRQRLWGAPITAFRCGGCGGDIVDHRVAYHVADLAQTRGTDLWFERAPAELVPEGYRCPHCGGAPEGFEKVEDILDVWFDSGVTWAAVLRDREGDAAQADLYLEGSDQHRGWFHTSLLTGVAIENRAPYRAVLTHGFVCDELGHKYSKSSPKYEKLDTMLEVYGAEVLRLWVAAVDYRNDVVLSQNLIRQIGDAYRKIRNTIRFMLGTLHDFDPAAHPLESALAHATTVDRWALNRTVDLVETVRAAYEAYEFHTVFHAVLEYCNQQMSQVYLDVLKDRLYVEAPDHPARRASQAVLHASLERLIGLLTPVLSFTTDEAWSFLPRDAARAEFAVLADFPTAPASWRDAEADARMSQWLGLRAKVSEEIEARRPKRKGERVEGQIGSSQEAVVTLLATSSDVAALSAARAELRELFIVSDVRVLDAGAAETSITVEIGDGAECPRCWYRYPRLGGVAAYPELCDRCGGAMTSIDATRGPSGPS